MSANLKWRPLPKEPKGYDISWLKEYFREKFYFDEGPVVIGNDTLPFLEGFVIGCADKEAKKDCLNLIAAIKKYGEVEIYLVY